jgi:hypothetical protein
MVVYINQLLSLTNVRRRAQVDECDVQTKQACLACTMQASQPLVACIAHKAPTCSSARIAYSGRPVLRASWRCLSQLSRCQPRRQGPHWTQRAQTLWHRSGRWEMHGAGKPRTPWTHLAAPAHRSLRLALHRPAHKRTWTCRCLSGGINPNKRTLLSAQAPRHGAGMRIQSLLKQLLLGG